MEYIGETGNNVRTRILQHIGYIRNKSDQPTGTHFNQRGHGMEYFTWYAFESFGYKCPMFRKQRETYRINQFQTIQPNGMNKIESF